MPTTTRLTVVKRIQEIYEKLDAEGLNSEELTELVQLSSDLYERALILRFKAAEERVFGPKTSAIEVEIVEEKEVEVLTETHVEIKEFDFAIFDQLEEKLPEPELVVTAPEIAAEEVKMEEEIPFVPEPIAETVVPTPEVKIPEVNIPEPPKMEEQEEVIAEKAAPIEENVAPATASGEWPKYFQKVIAQHSSGLQTQLSSLSGSFGLNERILYINELFGGEAEKFSEAIQYLDKIPDWNACMEALAAMGTERKWDLSDETIGEFVIHVKRKYV